MLLFRTYRAGPSKVRAISQLPDAHRRTYEDGASETSSKKGRIIAAKAPLQTIGASTATQTGPRRIPRVCAISNQLQFKERKHIAHLAYNFDHAARGTDLRCHLRHLRPRSWQGISRLRTGVAP